MACSHWKLGSFLAADHDCFSSSLRLPEVRKGLSEMPVLQCQPGSLSEAGGIVLTGPLNSVTNQAESLQLRSKVSHMNLICCTENALAAGLSSSHQ